MEERKLTPGEELVNTTFNPSQDPGVTKIKAAAANLIDVISEVNNEHVAPDDIVDGFVDKAVIDVISAQMFAVKAATWVTVKDEA